MTTYVWRVGEGLVEKYRVGPMGGTVYMPDIAEFRTTDGVTIASRSHLRDYEQRNQVRQIGDMAKPVRGRA